MEIVWKWKLVAKPDADSDTDGYDTRIEIDDLVESPLGGLRPLLVNNAVRNHILRKVNSLEDMGLGNQPDEVQFKIYARLKEPVSDEWTVPEGVRQDGFTKLANRIVNKIFPAYFVENARFEKNRHLFGRNSRHENLKRVVRDYNEWANKMNQREYFQKPKGVTFDPIQIPQGDVARPEEVQHFFMCLAKMVAARSLWPLAQLMTRVEGVLTGHTPEADAFRYNMGVKDLFDYSERVRGDATHTEYVVMCMEWLKGKSEFTSTELLRMARFLRNDILNSNRPRGQCRFEAESSFGKFGSWIYLMFYEAEFFMKSPDSLSEAKDGIKVQVSKTFFEDVTRLTVQPCPFCFRPTDKDDPYHQYFGSQFQEEVWKQWMQQCREIPGRNQGECHNVYLSPVPSEIPQASQVYDDSMYEEEEDADEPEPDTTAANDDARNAFHKDAIYDGTGCGYIKPFWTGLMDQLQCVEPTLEETAAFGTAKSSIDKDNVSRPCF